MRPALLIGAALLLLTAGCSGKVQHVDGPAAPVTASPAPSVTATSAAPATEPTRTPPTSAVPIRSSSRAAVLVLGPNGYGALKLGMSYRDASATGLIDPWQVFGNGSGPGCVRKTHLKASKDDRGFVYFSNNLGVEIIDAYGPSVRTPEGVHVGSTTAAMLRVYPKWTNVELPDPHAEGRGYVTVPGNSKADYRIVTRDGKVTELTLQYQKQDCYE
ncbi:hypothetical protein ODJ79_39480 [Actinoplanes sp. KI2]|uniref:hypothetical protein n=1 Tax=Actinoplanes sp. KI2 TaxID=2983315 RepID=UPI0021D5E05C|nr:hypothetical protein [Actinoplanes sp. KI2]MCU7729834.1 hypothetical protein [Actinoplanes sp. KI2]